MNSIIFPFQYHMYNVQSVSHWWKWTFEHSYNTAKLAK